ncbi:MAG: helix-turn-helix transcriptional regulator [Bacillota bacterium]|nr:helix-turn-helix transcriptional regulator [Bacillota bacterium]
MGERPAGAVGDLLALARRRASWAVPDLARRLGVTEETWDSWESGRRLPPVRRLEAISELLELPAERIATVWMESVDSESSLSEVAVWLARRGHARMARRLFARAVVLARRRGTYGQALEVRLRAADAELRWGDGRRARRQLQSVRRSARAAGELRLQAVAEQLLGLSAGERSDLERALQHHIVAYDTAQREQAPGEEMARVAINLGTVVLSLGLVQLAERWYRRALAMLAGEAPGRDEARARMGLGVALRRLGRAEEAFHQGRLALRAAREAGADDLLPHILLNVAIALTDAGRLHVARRIFTYLELHEPRTAREWAASFWPEAARAALLDGDFPEAEKAAKRALLAGASGLDAALAHLALGEVAAASQAAPEATAQYRLAAEALQHELQPQVWWIIESILDSYRRSSGSGSAPAADLRQKARHQGRR